MSSDRNLELMHRMYDALNSQDIDAHDEFWHRDMIWHGPSEFGSIHGLDNFKNLVLKPFYKAFPDYHAKNDIEVASGDWISATGIVTATHKGEWLGFAPTGRPIRMRYSDFWSVVNGKLKDNWVLVDHVDVFKQLGIDLLKNRRP